MWCGIVCFRLICGGVVVWGGWLWCWGWVLLSRIVLCGFFCIVVIWCVSGVVMVLVLNVLLCVLLLVLMFILILLVVVGCGCCWSLCVWVMCLRNGRLRMLCVFVVMV